MSCEQEWARYQEAFDRYASIHRRLIGWMEMRVVPAGVAGLRPGSRDFAAWATLVAQADDACGRMRAAAEAYREAADRHRPAGRARSAGA